MNLSEMFCQSAIGVALNSNTPEGSFEELVRSLAENDALENVDPSDVLQAVIKREELGCTAIGHGVAIPHAKVVGLSRVTGALAVSKTPLLFEDEKQGIQHQVSLIVLLLAPADAPGLHLHSLEKTSRALRDGHLVQSLIDAPDAEQLRELFFERDQVYA